MADISIQLDGHRVNLRAGAIVRDASEILLCRLSSEDCWYVPGGRIKTGESSLEALRRELTEELLTTFEVIAPLATAEMFFPLEGTTFHEVCTFYSVELTGPRTAVPLQHGNEIRAWFPLPSLPTLDVRPAFVKELVLALDRPYHLIVRRESDSATRPAATPDTDTHADAPARAALAYATEVTRTRTATDATFDALRPHFDERQIAELVWLVAFTVFHNTIARPLGLSSDGFCELLEQQPEDAG